MKPVTRLLARQVLRKKRWIWRLSRHSSSLSYIDLNGAGSGLDVAHGCCELGIPAVFLSGSKVAPDERDGAAGLMSKPIVKLVVAALLKNEMRGAQQRKITMLSYRLPASLEKSIAAAVREAQARGTVLSVYAVAEQVFRSDVAANVAI